MGQIAYDETGKVGKGQFVPGYPFEARIRALGLS